MQSLILGTAQWGMDYGVTNPGGRLTDEAISEITKLAMTLKIDALDTAPGYGDAEQRIGQLASGFRVQTKVSFGEAGPDGVRASIEASRARLRVSRLWSVLIHDWPSLPLNAQKSAAAVVEDARASGLVDRVGVSGYCAGDLAGALSAFSRLDVAQLPVNVLDQRLEGSPEVVALRGRGGTFQARSVLLQGVLSNMPSRLASHPDVAKVALQGNPTTLAMEYISTRTWVDEVVLGVTTAKELDELSTAWAGPALSSRWSSLASTDEKLLDPRQWEESA